MPGWTLPGFMTTGALQTLLRSYRVIPGQRVVVAGNGPLNLQVAAELVRNGAKVVALVEAARVKQRLLTPAGLGVLAMPALLSRAAGYLTTLKRAGVPILEGWQLVRADGRESVEAAVIERLTADGNELTGQRRQIEADVIGASYGFQAACELASTLACELELEPGRKGLVPVRHQIVRTSLDDVLVAGDAGGLGGAYRALSEGTLAGALAAERCGLGLPDALQDTVKREKRAHRRHGRFQRALWHVYHQPDFLDTSPDRLCDRYTVVCRCEDVTWAQLDELARDGWSVGNIKRQTRAGMGRCQGRTCSQAVQCIVARHQAAARDARSGWAPRLPIKPTSIAEILRFSDPPPASRDEESS